MNEIWFNAEREGVSYRQCSKLCGKDKSNIPIAFRGVSEESYVAKPAGTRKKCAATDFAPGHFAANDAATAERP
jgi:cytochrome c oxidase subunit II